MASEIESNSPQQEPPKPGTEPEDPNQAEDDREISEMVREAKQRKGTPGSNQAQNKSFRDAASGLTKKQMRRLHDEISGENYSYQEIQEIADQIRRGEL